jgi:hypothetical protein
MVRRERSRRRRPTLVEIANAVETIQETADTVG